MRRIKYDHFWNVCMHVVFVHQRKQNDVWSFGAQALLLKQQAYVFLEYTCVSVCVYILKIYI